MRGKEVPLGVPICKHENLKTNQEQTRVQTKDDFINNLIWVTTLCNSSNSISELMLTQGRVTLVLETLNLIDLGIC